MGAGNSAADTRLLAHELTHVVQQGAAPLKTATAPLQPALPGVAAHSWIGFGPGSASVGPDLPRMARPGAEGTIQRKIEKGKLNLVGESHDESEPRRAGEKAMLREKYAFPESQYWEEDQFYWDEAGMYADPRVFGCYRRPSSV